MTCKGARHPTMGEGETSRFDGADQPGCGGDIDDIDAEGHKPDVSAPRSFAPGAYAPEPGPGREPSAGEEGDAPTVDSAGSRGGEQGPASTAVTSAPEPFRSAQWSPHGGRTRRRAR